MPLPADTGIFFFHNPKAGGTAVAGVLAARFPEHRRSPLIENHAHDHARLAGDYSAFTGYAYYGGHYGRDVHDAVADGHATVTNVRDPVARLRSLHNYYRLEVDVPDDEATREILRPVVIAQACDLHDFVTHDDPAVRAHTCDFHTRQLTSTPWDVDAPADVDAALDLLESMAWIYVCEQPEASLIWARSVFGPALAAIPRVNVTVAARAGERAVVDVDERTRAAIRERNPGDLALHVAATARLGGTRRRRRLRWGRRR